MFILALFHVLNTRGIQMRKLRLTDLKNWLQVTQSKGLGDTTPSPHSLSTQPLVLSFKPSAAPFRPSLGQETRPGPCVVSPSEEPSFQVQVFNPSEATLSSAMAPAKSASLSDSEEEPSPHPPPTPQPTVSTQREQERKSCRSH